MVGRSVGCKGDIIMEYNGRGDDDEDDDKTARGSHRGHE